MATKNIMLFITLTVATLKLLQLYRHENLQEQMELNHVFLYKSCRKI